MAKDFYKRTDTKARLVQARFLELDDVGYLEITECICHEFGGFLSANGHTPSDEEEARLIGVPVEVHREKAERLLATGCLARTEDGRLYSPALLADLELRERRRERGRLGGNPDLVKQMPKQEVNQEDKQEVNQGVNYEDKLDVTITIPSSSDSPEGEESLSMGDGASSALLADPDWFEKCLALYPKRAGSNSKKAAKKAAKARLGESLDDGTPITEKHLIEATRLYAEEIRILGWENTEYVKQGSTFYGSDGHVQAILAKDYTPPKSANGGIISKGPDGQQLGYGKWR